MHLLIKYRGVRLCDDAEGAGKERRVRVYPQSRVPLPLTFHFFFYLYQNGKMFLQGKPTVLQNLT